MKKDDFEIRRFDKEVYMWSRPELERTHHELKKVFEELLVLANNFEDTSQRQRLLDFCFKLIQKVSILELALATRE